MRTICIATGTRADWGLLSAVAKGLQQRKDVKVHIIATNMHLIPKYGNTYKEIINDGFRIAAHVPLSRHSDTPTDIASNMGIAMKGFANAFEELSPDLLIILGDRSEMLAVASTALIFRIPVVHIAGGEISEGAYDDNIRHAITKLSHIHLTETEEYRRRVIQLGENPAHVFNTGAIGVYNAMFSPLMDYDELVKSLGGVKVDRNTLLVTFHPATLDAIPSEEQCRNMLAALDSYPECNIIFTYPNNDTNGFSIINLIEYYAGRNKGRVSIFPSLGQKRYFSVLKYAGAVVGNSSSGIVEVPSMGIPTLDIGIRQRGRIAAPSVVHCGVSCNEIKAGLDKVRSQEMLQIASKKVNPYYKENTLELMLSAICDTPLDNLLIKHFYDIPQ